MTTDGRDQRRVALVLVSALTTAVVGLLIAGNLARTNSDVADLLLPGALGPSVHAIRADFPEKQLLPHDVGSDGQQFYAIARSPLHLRSTAGDLDRPRYRLQRIAYPALAALLVLGAKGKPLVLGLLAVNLLAVFVGCVAFGALAMRAGRPPLFAAVFAVLPGAFLSVRMSASDALALAFALVACALVADGRPGVAAVAATVAVLAKESSYLVVAPVAISIARRTRVDARAPLVAPIVVAAGWWLYLRIAIPVQRGQYLEFAPPLVGLVRATGAWWSSEPGAAVVVVLGIAIGVAALVRAPRGPFALAIAVQLAFLSVLSKPTYQYFVSGPRTVLPVMALGVLAIVTPANATASIFTREG